MVFSNFAQVLYSVLAEGRSFAQFTRNLFLNITDYSDSEENPIEDAEDGTLKAYYTGKNGISRFAKKINSHLDTQKFEMYLERFPVLQCLFVMYFSHLIHKLMNSIAIKGVQAYLKIS